VTIDDKTKIPLFSAIGGVSLFIGGIFWLATLMGEVKAHTKEIDKLHADQREEMKVLLEIRERVIRLEEKASK
jgi:hypothetical protein